MVDYQIILNIISISLSLMGNIFIIFCFIKFKHLSQFVFKLVLFLSISDILKNISQLFILEKPNGNNFLCNFQSFFLVFSDLSVQIWTTIIAYIIQTQILKSHYNIYQHKNIFFILSYLIPIFLAFLPLTSYSYGPYYNGCSFDFSVSGFIWFFIISFIISLIAIIYNIIKLVQVLKCFNKYEKENDNFILKEEFHFIKKFSFFPMISIICSMNFLTINFLIRIGEMKNFEIPISLIIFFNFVYNLQGLFNGVCFLTTPRIKEYWMKSLKKKKYVYDKDENELRGRLFTISEIDDEEYDYTNYNFE